LGTKDKNLVSVPQVLYTILKLAGIECKENPSLIAWKTQLAIERQIEILTVEQFIKNFGPGLYQIYVKNPEITSIDPEAFKVKSLSITIAYQDDGGWGEPHIQTEEEEISPRYMDNFNELAQERAIKIANKVKDVFIIVAQLWQQGDNTFGNVGG